MLMEKPAAFIDSQSLDGCAPAHLAPAPTMSTALWFLIGLLASALLLYASARYGIASPDVLG